MTAAAATLPPDHPLARFVPLRRAEAVLLRACRHGDIARIGLRRPREASPEVTVRASFLAALALITGAHRQSRRIQLLGAWIEGRLDLGECPVPASLWQPTRVINRAREPEPRRGLLPLDAVHRRPER